MLYTAINNITTPTNLATMEYKASLQRYKQLCIAKGYMDSNGQWIGDGQTKAVQDKEVYEAAAQSRAKFERANQVKQHETYRASEAKRYEKERKSIAKQQKEAMMKGLRTDITPDEAAQARIDYDNYTKQLDELDTNAKNTATQSTDDWLSAKQKEEFEKQEADKKEQEELKKDMTRAGEAIKAGAQKAGKWLLDNNVPGQFLESMNKGMNAVKDREAPESNTLRDRASEQARIAAQAEERKNIAEGESKRNVQALASSWTETAANNAANVAAAAQGGDTGAGAAIARMQAAQGARDKEGAANLQKAQQRADTYEQLVSQRLKDEDAARAGVTETQLQLHETQQKHKAKEERNRALDELHQRGMKNVGAGPTTAEMDGNQTSPPPTPANVAGQTGAQAGQAQETNPQTDGRTQNAQYNKDGVNQGIRDALLKKANSGEMLTQEELDYAKQHNIPTKDGKIEKLSAVTSSQDPTLIRRDKETAFDARKLTNISDMERKKIIDAYMKLHSTNMDERERELSYALNQLKNDTRNDDATSQENARRRKIEIMNMVNNILGGK